MPRSNGLPGGQERRPRYGGGRRGAREDELDRPLLVIHSDGDDFVPIGPAVQLARRRPDILRFERWDVARHCREWNYDPQRWERVVGEFLTAL